MSDEKDKLRPCPFCGSEAEITQTGKRQLRVRCNGCYMGVEQKVLRYSLEWLREKLTENWNRRVA